MENEELDTKIKIIAEKNIKDIKDLFFFAALYNIRGLFEDTFKIFKSGNTFACDACAFNLFFLMLECNNPQLFLDSFIKNLIECIALEKDKQIQQKILQKIPFALSSIKENYITHCISYTEYGNNYLECFKMIDQKKLQLFDLMYQNIM